MGSSDENSAAWKAHNTQGSGGYPGNDTFQNGVIEKGSNQTLYVAEFDSGDSTDSSGYFTDESTIDSCTHDGVLDANELGDKCQTASSNYTFDEDGTRRINDEGVYKQRSNVNAYDINWDRLDELKEENPELYDSLTDESGNLKCAYGKAEANTQYGDGGGNQYYIDKDTFNDAKDAGVIEYNEEKSFSEDKGNLKREDISRSDGEQQVADAKEVADSKKTSEQLNYTVDEDGTKRIKEDSVEEGKDNELPEKTPEQVNSDQVDNDPSNNYICQPDERYGYDQDQGRDNVRDNAGSVPDDDRKSGEQPGDDDKNPGGDDDRKSGEQPDDDRNPGDDDRKSGEQPADDDKNPGSDDDRKSGEQPGDDDRNPGSDDDRKSGEQPGDDDRNPGGDDNKNPGAEPDKNDEKPENKEPKSEEPKDNEPDGPSNDSGIGD